MGESTKIAWTDHTFNPWWGCQRVSPGCEHCYAETFAKRVGLKVWGPQSERRFFGDKHWAEPLKWNRKAAAEGRRARVFCASMADVFEDRVDLVEHRVRLVRLIAATPHLDWLLLTKRPENMLQLGAEAGLDPEGWPSNVWAGTTAEDGKSYMERWPILARVPARVRFISHEPALAPIHNLFAEGLVGHREYAWPDWIITGGESGPGARPYALLWARELLWARNGVLRKHGAERGSVAIFVKQLGSKPFGDLLSLKDRAGADPAEWPEDLRVREWPGVRRG